MARKGPQQERRPAQTGHGPREEQRQDGSDASRAAIQDAAAATQGPSAGAEAPRAAGPRDQETRREGESSTGATDFALQLAELAAAHLGEEASASLDGEGYEGGEWDHEAATLDRPNELSGQRASSLSAGGARRGSGRKEFGGESEPEDEDASSRPATRAATSSGNEPQRVRPKKRAEHVELQALLEHAVDLKLLNEYHCSCVEPTLLRLTWQEFEQLQAALDLCGTAVQRILVLAALAAHRAPAQLHDLALALGSRDEGELLERFSPGAGATRPGTQASIEELRLCYDPIAALAGTQRDRCDDAANGEEWKVPMWLRGVPAEPLEMAAVAIDQRLCGDLGDDPPSAEGADELLTRALEHHAQQHPALQRWFLALCARADSRQGLIAARETVLRARNQLLAGD